MKTPTNFDIQDRKPLWLAFSVLFLDTEISDDNRRYIARTVMESKYNPKEVYDILWLEVFPALCDNLRIATGEWAGFDENWLIHRIINVKAGIETAHTFYGLISVKHVKSIIADEWRNCCIYIEDDYSGYFCPP